MSFCEMPGVGHLFCGVLGFPESMAIYLFFMLLAYPMNYALLKMPASATVKHIFSLLGGLGFCYGVFGEQIMHPLITTAVTFLLIKFSGKSSVLLVFTFSTLYMSISHIYRQYTDYLGWSLDYTGPQMILTLKYISVAWNVRDAAVKGPAAESLSPDQKAAVVPLTKFSLLEYFSYCFYFGGFLSGPFLEYRHFCEGVDQSCYAKSGVPSTELPALRRFVEAVFLAVLQIGLQSYFYMDMTLTPDFVLRPLYEKIGCWLLILIAIRSKYYFAWRLAEGSLILGGIGYTGVDKKTGEHTWHRACNAAVLKVEFGMNLREVIAAWNKNTAYFLKEYVYLRVPHKFKAWNTICTFTFSAFWHGFYPGYYWYFVTTGALSTPLSQNARRYLRPYFMKDEKEGKYPAKYLYDLSGMACTNIMNNYLAIPFQVLSLDRILRAYGDLGYSVHIALAVGYVLMSALQKMTKTPKSARTGEAAVKKAQ